MLQTTVPARSSRSIISLPERRRAPREPHELRLSLSDILVITKASRVELDRAMCGRSAPNGGATSVADADLRQWYRAQGLDADRLFASHERQRDAIEEARALLPPGHVIARDELTEQHLAHARVIVALGGDNHLCWVAQRLTGQLLVGVNSDPLSSEGALTLHRSSDLSSLIRRVTSGDFMIEQWTRLDVSVDGVFIGRALNDVFLGERERQYMSRHLLRSRGSIEEQKGSGLLVSTGANSHGWYRSASRYLHAEGAPFPKTAPLFRYLLTEPYCGTLSCPTALEGDLGEGDTLELTSFNDADGVVTVDSLVSAPFGRGAQCSIQISKHPLHVICD